MRRSKKPLEGGTIRRAPVNRNPPPDSRGVRAYMNALHGLGEDPATDDRAQDTAQLDTERIAQLESDVSEARDLARRLDRGDRLSGPVPDWLRTPPNEHL